MNELIKKLQLQLQILQLQLQVLILRQKLTIPNLDNPTKIIIHHGSGWLDFNGVNEYHKNLWGFKSSLGYYCGYQYFIERDGFIHRSRKDNEEGAHCIGQNKTSIGICLCGNGQEKDFTWDQYNSLEVLIEKKRQECNISKSNVCGHRDFSNTICPSDILYQWVQNYKGR